MHSHGSKLKKYKIHIEKPPFPPSPVLFLTHKHQVSFFCGIFQRYAYKYAHISKYTHYKSPALFLIFNILAYYEDCMYCLHFTFKFNVHLCIKHLQSLVWLGRIPLCGTPAPRDLGFFQLFAITKKIAVKNNFVHRSLCTSLQVYLRNKFLEVELWEQMVYAFKIFTDLTKSPSIGVVSVNPPTSSVSWQRLTLLERNYPLCRLLGAMLWASKGLPLWAGLPSATHSTALGKSCQQPVD